MSEMCWVGRLAHRMENGESMLDSGIPKDQNWFSC